MNPEKILKFIFLSFIFFGASAVTFLGVQWFSNSVTSMLANHNNLLQSSLETSTDNAKASVFQNAPASISQNLLPLRDWRVSELNVGAQAAISVETDPTTQKVLFKKNEEKKLPIASLTKLMTAVVVLDNYDMSQKVTVDQLAMMQEGEQGVLKLGQVLTVKDLLYITLMESSNRAAYALSEVIGTDTFITLMNVDAKKMGLENTHFEDATGLDQGDYSTVKDLAVLSQYLFENYPLFKQIVGSKTYDLYMPDGTLHHTLISTNQFLGEDNVVGGKTGFTNEARGCFMIVQTSAKQGDYIISIVLGAEDRFLEMAKVMHWVSTAYEW